MVRGEVGEMLAGVFRPEFVGEYCECVECVECVDLRYAWCW